MFSVLANLFLLSTVLPFTIPTKTEPTSSAYNETLAKRYFYLSASAYGTSQPKCLSKVFNEDEMPKVVSLSDIVCDEIGSGCSSFIIVSEKLEEIIVVFRGTRAKQQFLVQGISLLFDGISFFRKGHVNRYFYRAHVRLWEEVEKILRHQMYANFSVTFTGHSLGGAIASITAARTVFEGIRKSEQVQVYTFGQPRTGNSLYAKNFDAAIENSFRVVFRHDIVPHVPGCDEDHRFKLFYEAENKPCDPTVPAHWYHHSTEIWYPECMTEGCEYKECRGYPKGEDFSCSNGYRFVLGEIGEYIWDHRHYFGVTVSSFGKAECDATSPTYEFKPYDTGDIGVFLVSEVKKVVNQIQSWLG